MGRDARDIVEKVTYVTLSTSSAEVDEGFRQANTVVTPQLGRECPSLIAGTPRTTAEIASSTSPIDTRTVVARAHVAGSAEIDAAIAAAAHAFPDWRRRPFRERADILARAAQLIRARRFELAVWMIHEMGKNRVEALGEVEETADLIDYYIAEMDANDGFVRPMGRLSPADTNTSVMRPYGAWAVISPWNFPYALLAAPIAAALLTGNTVLGKPSSETPLTGQLMAEIFVEAGLPEGTLSLLHGSGVAFGRAIIDSEQVGGLTFTGSYEVGFERLYKAFATRYPRPCIVEMGGKNPAIIMDSADLERAVAGVYRSAFGMNGHKCSACSRVYVHRAVREPFLEMLTEKVRGTVIGNPLDPGIFVGPLATEGSLRDYERYAEAAQAAGVLNVGGRRLHEGGFAHGYFVEPTVLVDVPETHELMRQELFVPMLAVNTVSSLDEAMARANDTAFGLTAGFFSERPEEIERFFDEIQAGVVYVNRAAGATTGAWPGVQPFGGWKGSGSTGKAIGGHYTLQCYLREQSRTLTR